MTYSNIELKYENIISEACSIMSTIEDHEHSLGHMFDVVDNVKLILDELAKENVECNQEACILAAYWHDVGRATCSQGHEELSANMLREKLLDYGYSEDFAICCYNAIRYHKWSMTPETVEGNVLRDADKLAFIGEKRWNECLQHNQRLDSIIELLPNLRSEILHYECSREIYDKQIVNLFCNLYENQFK